jgi:hypothetical protein
MTYPDSSTVQRLLSCCFTGTRPAADTSARGPPPQVESTIGLQSLQPRVKELQAKYANDTETLQIETARLYKEAGVNPLAGCLPTLATIPVFIGLYRALTKAADDGLLTSGFFWIPSLGGPTTLTARQAVRGQRTLPELPASAASCAEGAGIAASEQKGML